MSLYYIAIFFLLLSNVVVWWLTPLLRIQEALSSYLGPETVYPGCAFRGFPLSFQVNAWIVPKLGHGSFLLYRFQFIFHLQSIYSTLYNLS
jgi:hypothetical protein